MENKTFFFYLLTLRQEKSLIDHTFRVVSAEDDNNTWSIGEKRTHHTPRLCPRHTPTTDKSVADHIY